MLGKKVKIFFCLILLATILPFGSKVQAATEGMFEGKLFSVKPLGLDFIGFYVDNILKGQIMLTTFANVVQYDEEVQSVDSITIANSISSSDGIPDPGIIVNWTVYRNTGLIHSSSTQDIAPLIDGKLAEPTFTKSGSTVNIQYPTQATYKKYRVNSGVWTNYTVPITGTSGLIEAISGDNFGRRSTISYIYLNTVSPTITLSASPSAAPTNKAIVTATINSQNGISEKKYIYGSYNIENFPTSLAEILPSNNQFTANFNGTFTVMVKDNNGIAAVQRISLDYIDNQSPATPFITLTSEKPTTQITATMSFGGNDVVKKQYQIDDGSWIDYTVPLNITKNCKLTAKSTDAAGNIAIYTRNIRNILELQDYIYGTNGRLIEVRTTNGDFRYNYDNNGNLISIVKI